MALINREIRYRDVIDFIEHKTGKKVKSWKNDMSRLQKIIIFTDNTCCYLDECMLLTNNIVFQPLPKSFCACCGEEMHAGKIDFAGRCEVKLKGIWESARKIFWYRYLKNKSNTQSLI